MTYDGGGTTSTAPVERRASPPLIIASILREQGSTGVNTHVSQLQHHLEECGTQTTLVTPFSWGGRLTVPAFAPRLALYRVSRPASVVWYRHWHEDFLYRALRRVLAAAGDCVVYAQGPVEARAALRARLGSRQRVVMAVHFQTSQADEWASKKDIRHDGRVFRSIRAMERDVVMQLDGVVYVSRWARDALLSWLPEAEQVPSAIVENFVAPPPPPPIGREAVGDLVTTGALELAKNHRYLLQVLAEARRLGRPLTLDVFGEGPYRKDLEDQARTLGLDGQVRLRGFRRDVREFLPGYRAYVHASYVESSSLAIIEAMAAGLPIVAGKIGGIAELLDDGVEGRFWTLDDPAEAAATLLGLVDCEPARREAGRAAEERFHRDFDANVVAPRLWKFLSTTAV